MARARRRQSKTRRKKTRPAPKRRIRVTVPRPTRAEAPREVYGAWIKSRREKTTTLALSWAREQLRLSLEETIARSPRIRPAGGLRPDTLAWLLLAACEAIAHEPPSAIADRIRIVLELSGHAAPGG